MTHESVLSINVKAKIGNKEIHEILININGNATEKHITNLIKESLKNIDSQFCKCKHSSSVNKICTCGGGKWNGDYDVIEVKNISNHN